MEAQAAVPAAQELIEPREISHAPSGPPDSLAPTEDDICRVCRGESTATHPLFYPCQCKGSIKYIHQDCLMEWLGHTRSRTCELCKHPFQFTPIYADDTPSVLPLSSLVMGIVARARASIARSLWLAVVISTWLFLVPLCTAAIWRLYLGRTPASHLFLSSGWIVKELMLGMSLTGLTLLLYMCMVFFARYIRTLRQERAMLLAAQAQPEPAAPVPPVALAEAEPAGAPAPQPPAAAGEAPAAAFAAADNVVAAVPAAAPLVVAAAGAAAADDAVGGDLLMAGAGAGDALLDLLDEPQPEDDAADIDDLLGLDGPWRRLLTNSLCVVVFNGAFLGVFVLLPYVFGRLALFATKRTEVLVKLVDGSATNHTSVESAFDTHDIWTLTLGYGCMAIMLLMVSSVLSGLFTQHAVARAIRGGVCLCYTFVKVCVLLALEMGVLPLLCGAFVVTCTLDLFGSRVQRVTNFYLYVPWTCTMLLWTLGVFSLYYFGRLLMLIRELTRPQVLWFLRDPNNFHPIKDMIELPLKRHARRLALSLVFWAVVVCVTVYLPVQLLTRAVALRLSLRALHDAFVETPLTLFALNLILPYSLQHLQPSVWIRTGVLAWLKWASRLCALDGYIMPDPANAAALPPPAASVPRFKLKLLAFLALAAATLSAVASFLFVPLFLGRAVCVFVFEQPNDLSSFSVGLFVMLAAGYASKFSAAKLVQHARTLTSLGRLFVLSLKVAFLSALWLVAIPLLLGVLFELLFVVPLRNSAFDTPVFSLYQDWALGLVYLKIWVRLVMALPQNKWKAHFDQILNDGFANMQTVRILRNVILPVANALLIFACVPYVVVAGVLPFFIKSPHVLRMTFNFAYLVTAAAVLVWHAILNLRGLFWQLHNELRDERYLVGRMLHNYQPRAPVRAGPSS